MQFAYVSFIFSILIFLQSCTSNGPNVDLHSKKAAHLAIPDVVSELFGVRPAIITMTDIFALNNKQKGEFLAYYNDPSRSEIAGNQRLYDYLDVRVSGFTYKGETNTAQQALAKNRGNCLSLAIVTTALANLVGLEIEYQQVNSEPVYDMHEDILLLAGHVRTLVYQPNYLVGKEEIIIARPRIVIDYFPSRQDYFSGIVAKQDFVSMYYQNLAAKYMVSNDYPAAFWLVKEAFKYSPLNPESINMLAVIYTKVGRYDLAEQWYKFGIQQVGGSLNLLSNYRSLLLTNGRSDEAHKYDQMLDEYDDNNPYIWLDLGHEAYKHNNYARSIKYFEKAIRMAPYLDKGHFELARALYASNELAAAAASMRNAIRAAFELEDREMYYAKLKALKSEFAQ